MRNILSLSVLLVAVTAAAAQPDKKLALVDGKFGKALDAKATPTSVEGADRYRQPPLTVECWARLTDRDNFNVIVSSDPKNSSRHWEIYTYANSGTFSAYLPGYEPSEIRSKTGIVNGIWRYLAMTFDGKTVTLYVDGKRVAEQAVKPKEGLKPVDGALMFGQAILGNQRIGCDGLIDDVRISNVVRTITDIPDKELANDPQTVGIWRFDKDEGLKGDPAWTPPPILGGKAEPWEKMTDKDWIDARFRATDTGPFLGATFNYPSWKGTAKAYKGIAIKIGDKGEGAVLFDRNQLRLAAGWTGGWLNHSDKRFGLMNTPTPAGIVIFATTSQPGWGYPRESLALPAVPPTAPLPKDWGHYNGLYTHGNRTVLSYRIGDAEVLESPWIESDNGLSLLTRTFEVGPWRMPLRVLAGEFPAEAKEITIDGQSLFAARHNGVWHVLAVVGVKDHVTPRLVNKTTLEVVLPDRMESRYFKIVKATTSDEKLDRIAKAIKASPPPGDIRSLTKPGPARWTKEIVTRGEVAKDDAPYVIDTLTLPYDNPYKALFFVTGIDFLPDGTIAICTAHGDVWLAKADAKLEKIVWKRFATGLYQPMGLKVVDGKIVVLERGQLTRLHDTNNDGEADFYENLNNDWHTGGGEHSYDTCLETDPQGNFYFFKTGDPETPTGGCLLKVSKDGSKSEIFSTGFRHPIGLGMSPTGLLTGADQEGNWMPATRIDAYKKGGFYGDMRAHHRATPPKIYDPPMLWLPREADNSAGGQVWIPRAKWGPLAGKMLHLSYGRCQMLLVMPQVIGETMQAGAVDFGLKFLSGVKSGRFHPIDGHLYVVGLNGWQTAAKRDGCLQRVRYTGKPVRMPIAMSVQKDGINVEFAEALDPKSAVDVTSWKLEQWGYRWSADYGSRHWSVVEPTKEAHDPVALAGVSLSADGKIVFLKIDKLQPVMQMLIGYSLKGADGAKVEGKVFNTVHEVGR